MIEVLVIFILSSVIIGLVIERYFYQKQMLKQLDDAIKASMSRNINEYLVATSKSTSKKEPEPENDLIDLSEADDEIFNKFINKDDRSN